MEHPQILVELGAILLGLAVLSRVATFIGMPTIPLYLTAGLAFGRGGLVPLVTAEDFVQVGAEIGLILLLLMLGLEYTAAELTSTLRTQARVGAVDFLLNFTPGFGAGLWLGWDPVLAFLLGGITYVSSSGIVAKVLSDQGWTGNRETPAVLSALVIEDLVMTVYLPVAAALLVGGGTIGTLTPALLGVAVVVLVLGAATKIEVGVSRVVFSRSDEALLLTILGMTIFIAGTAELFGLSAAVAALLIGIVLSGPAAEAAHGLLSPMRDLFAAIFFAFVGLSVDPASIPPVLAPAAGLAVVTSITKFATGWLGARRSGVGIRGRTRAGAMLTARGEFSIAIAGLATAAGVVAGFEALAISYVFVLAIVGPIFVRFAEPIGTLIVRRAERHESERTARAAP
ncbi:MAG TPA: cation:proton antiporter [Actinomycetota bacterium]|nr:cation:proton antiporter [Actinomycetota bacterium]